MAGSTRIAMMVTLTVCGTLAAQELKLADGRQATPAVAGAPAADNMTPYRTLAADTLKAFKAHDMPTAKKKARELEVAWDKNEKVLQKKSASVWEQIDKAMDAFIKPVMHDKSPDSAKVQAAYDTFVAKLQLGVNADAAPKPMK